MVWFAYILSEGDHCLHHVESWAAGLLETLSTALGVAVRALDCGDDRLAVVLDQLSEDDDWEGFEVNLNRCLRRVYDLKVERVRTDSTSGERVG